MHMLRSPRVLFGLTLAALCLPLTGQAQERAVVSKEIAVGRAEAALRLEFSSGDPLEIALRDGVVLIGGEAAGDYQAGDALDAAWRTLLGEAVALENGPLADRLREWSPPADLAGDRLEPASAIDRSLEDALTAAEAVAGAPSIGVSSGDRDDAELVRALLGRAEHLTALGEALRNVDSNMELHVGEDVEVAAGETVQGTLVVVQGDARIEGEVTGSVIVVDGTLRLGNASRVGGDVRLAEATLRRDGGTVVGEVANIEGSGRDLESEIRNRVREELRSELRQELRSEARGSRSGGFNPFRGIFRAIGGLIENMVGIFFLGLVGMGIVAFAPTNLDTVAETARRAPGRAAMVGVAGTFLLIPVWVLGAIALAVSIVGIPVMIAWLPLFPLAAFAAAVFGYVAVARNVGEWLADSGYRYTDWIRKSNPVHTIVGGVVGLTLFFIAANVLQAIPFFGFFRGLLQAAGVLATIAAVQIGFGAVLLTRAGRRREYVAPDFDEAWERAVDVDMDAATGSAAPGEAEKDAGGDHA